MEPKFTKRDFHGLRKFFCLQSQGRITAEEAIEELHGGRVISAEAGDGVVRVKIVMSKQELKQMVASMRHECSDADRHRMPTPQSFEQSLYALRWRRMKRAESMKGRSGWMPALQSIPEEN